MLVNRPPSASLAFCFSKFFVERQQQGEEIGEGRKKVANIARA